MTYLIIKALHIISVISFMAGIMYLPRLFAYHVTVPIGSDQDKLFQTMEARLMRIIINPALGGTWIFGLWMLYLSPDYLQQPWFHAKAALVIILSGFHGACSKWRKQLATGNYVHSNKFFRAVNEIPAVLMVLIVLLVVLKPF
jgi:protoporphyrinogen IX oxidase